MMRLTFGLFTQVSGSGPLGPLVLSLFMCSDVMGQHCPRPRASASAELNFQTDSE